MPSRIRRPLNDRASRLLTRHASQGMARFGFGFPGLSTRTLGANQVPMFSAMPGRGSHREVHAAAAFQSLASLTVWLSLRCTRLPAATLFCGPRVGRWNEFQCSDGSERPCSVYGVVDQTGPSAAVTIDQLGIAVPGNLARQPHRRSVQLLNQPVSLQSRRRVRPLPLTLIFGHRVEKLMKRVHRRRTVTCVVRAVRRNQHARPGIVQRCLNNPQRGWTWRLLDGLKFPHVRRRCGEKGGMTGECAQRLGVLHKDLHRRLRADNNRQHEHVNA